MILGNQSFPQLHGFLGLIQLPPRARCCPREVLLCTFAASWVWLFVDNIDQNSAANSLVAIGASKQTGLQGETLIRISTKRSSGYYLVLFFTAQETDSHVELGKTDANNFPHNIIPTSEGDEGQQPVSAAAEVARELCRKEVVQSSNTRARAPRAHVILI